MNVPTTSKLRYFYAKLGKANQLAESCLNGNLPIHRSAVPIFFDLHAPSREQFLAEGFAKEQGQNFFWCEDHPAQARIVVLHNAELYVLRPTDDVVFWKCVDSFGYAGPGDYVKFLPVESIGRFPFADIPLTLASMSASAYYYMGTFREILDSGNIRALQCVLGEDPTPVETPQDLLGCLSSVELETLTAKILEAAGCFVPAYRGGVLRDIDIVARNSTADTIEVLGMLIPPNEGRSLQVKRKASSSIHSASCDRLVCGERDAAEILEHAKAQPLVRSWLALSLAWLPGESMVKFGLA